ncbi:MAG TPA: hypothetical protein VJB67_01955 [Patescibacteria group bacterium]|nr:hypothetical protein [Patescibacteria group bacterium]
MTNQEISRIISMAGPYPVDIKPPVRSLQNRRALMFERSGYVEAIVPVQPKQRSRGFYLGDDGNCHLDVLI